MTLALTAIGLAIALVDSALLRRQRRVTRIEIEKLKRQSAGYYQSLHRRPVA